MIPHLITCNVIHDNNFADDSTFDDVPGSEGAAFQLWNKETCADVVQLFTVTSKAIQSIKGLVISLHDITIFSVAL